MPRRHASEEAAALPSRRSMRSHRCRAEGEAKRRAEGELLGQQKVALKMLRKGLGVEEVSTIAEIDAEDVHRLSRLIQEFGTAAEEHCSR